MIFLKETTYGQLMEAKRTFKGEMILVRSMHPETSRVEYIWLKKGEASYVQSFQQTDFYKYYSNRLSCDNFQINSVSVVGVDDKGDSWVKFDPDIGVVVNIGQKPKTIKLKEGSSSDLFAVVVAMGEWIQRHNLIRYYNNLLKNNKVTSIIPNPDSIYFAIDIEDQKRCNELLKQNASLSLEEKWQHLAHALDMGNIEIVNMIIEHYGASQFKKYKQKIVEKIENLRSKDPNDSENKKNPSHYINFLMNYLDEQTSLGKIAYEPVGLLGIKPSISTSENLKKIAGLLGEYMDIKDYLKFLSSRKTAEGLQQPEATESRRDQMFRL